MKNILSAILLAFGLTAASHAEKTAITNGQLHTIDAGVIENGTLLLEDGKITGVGTNITVPVDARVIDAKGKPVTPGLFDAISSLGLSEVTLSAGIEDDEARTSRLKIAPDASFAFNPDNTYIPSTRISGVTRTATSMKVTGSIFAGRGAIVDMGLGPDHMTRPRAFLFADLGEKGGNNAGGSRAASWVELYAALKEADNLISHPRNHWQGGKGETLFSRVDLEALLPAAQGDVPFIIHVERKADILNVIKLKQNRPQLRIALYGATEAWRVADELAAAGIAVLVHPLANLPRDFNKIGATMENASRLQDAGVKIAITSWGRRYRHYSARLLPHFAGNAVANGLTRDEAMHAITLGPAEIYGVSDRLGSLTVGKEADVVIWSGDPLELMEAPTMVIIRGKEIPLVSRQTMLRDRYREID